MWNCFQIIGLLELKNLRTRLLILYCCCSADFRVHQSFFGSSYLDSYLNLEKFCCLIAATDSGHCPHIILDFDRWFDSNFTG
jgi:hypothetical protein